MTSENTTEDFNLGRGWLNRAASAVIAGQDSPPAAVQFARAAAMIGNGFIALAHAERAAASMAETSQVRQAILTMSDEPETTLVEAIAREQRAEAEARPHDDEPVLGDVIKCQQCGRQTRSISRGCSSCGLGKPSDDEPRPGDLVRVYGPGHKDGVLSTVDQFGGYDGKAEVAAGAARMSIFKRAGDRG